MDTIDRNDALARLDRDGFALIPLEYGTKRPTCARWQNHDHAANDVEALQDHEGNIGIVLGQPSGNRVDIDLDHPIALKIADLVLPPTQIEFGRRSTPRAHRIFWVEGDAGPTAQFKLKTARPDVDRQMIVEYRAKGAQTMCPPSIHPETSEPVEFQKYGPSGKATREGLLWGCGIIAAVAELEPHYPKGTRQHVVLALSGMLASVSSRLLGIQAEHGAPWNASSSWSIATSQHHRCCQPRCHEHSKAANEFVDWGQKDRL